MSLLLSLFSYPTIYLYHCCFVYISFVLFVTIHCYLWCCLLPWGLRRLSVCLQGLQCRRPKFSPWVGKIWRRKWQPTPVLLPGKFHGQRSLVGYSPWSHKESDTTEPLHFTSLLRFHIQGIPNDIYLSLSGLLH